MTIADIDNLREPQVVDMTIAATNQSAPVTKIYDSHWASQVYARNRSQ